MNPLDLTPEFVPVIGPFDDVIVTALVLRHLVKRAGRETVVDHWRDDPATLAAGFRLAALRSGPPAGASPPAALAEAALLRPAVE